MHTSFPPCDSPRARYLRVRLADHEHARLSALAAAQGLSVSELVRRSLPLDDQPVAGSYSDSFPPPSKVVVTHKS